MQQDSLLAKYAAGKGPLPIDEASDNDVHDDLGAFGWLRGIRDRAVFLEFRRKDGSVIAYPYHWLGPAEFNPSDGISLKFGVATVKITGRNLNTQIRPNVRLFAGIMRQRVIWIQEADQAMAMTAGNGAVVVESIAVKG